MKKLLFLTITVLSLVSCSSNDYTPDTINDPIIGKWQFVSSPSVNDPIDPCELKNTTEFLENGEFTAISMAPSNGGCIVDDTTTGKWKKNQKKFTKILLRIGLKVLQ